MARFDVHARPRERGSLLDCQTDFLADLDTRLMVPLFLGEDFRRPARRLNPVFRLHDQDVVMMTQYLSALRKRQLGPRIGSLALEQNAIDFLPSGI